MIKVTLEIEKDNDEIEITYMELDNIAFAGKHFGEESIVSAVVGRYSIVDQLAVANHLRNAVVKEVLSREGEDILEDLLDALEGGGYSFD